MTFPTPRTSSRILALIAWAILLAAWGWYTHTHNLTPAQTVARLAGFLSASPWGVFLYIIIYFVRPVFLFPPALLTMAAGYIFGPLPGIFYALVASNLASLVSYTIGRYFGGSFRPRLEQNPKILAYAERLRRESFQTPLILRFLFIPYDFISAFSGFLNIDLRLFMLATVIGSVPGTVSFALLGASIQGDFATQQLTLNPLSLFASLAVFAVTILLYRLVRRKEAAI